MEAKEQPGQKRGENLLTAQMTEFSDGLRESEQKKNQGSQREPISSDDQRRGFAKLDEDGSERNGYQSDGQKDPGPIMA
jgi:hypothetical protein